MAATAEQITEKCTILELLNIEKYTQYLALDEDSQRAESVLVKFFDSFHHYDSYEVSDGLYIMKKMDRQIAKMYEEAFVVGDSILVYSLIDLTPRVLFSLSDWGTLAITMSISPDDLREVSYTEYAQRENCRARVGYPDINEKVYHEFIEHHDAQHAQWFKQQLANGNQ